MFYQNDHGLKAIDIRNWNSSSLLFGIGSQQELAFILKQCPFYEGTLQEYHQDSLRMHHKMDSYFGYDFGMLQQIKKQKQGFSKLRIAVYIQTNMILVLCEDPIICRQIEEVVCKINEKTFCKEHMISAILHCIVEHHTQMLEEMETTMTRLDERILDNHTEDFNQRIRVLRNDLLFLTHYYEQLMDVCDELLQDENGFFQDEELHHLRIMADRIGRLSSNVRLLKDYMVQIQNAYQSQVDMNLNHIMYFFTIITTIFLPLTLIVGWYGMNFKNMPELSWTYGYPLVILISILTVIACILFFRRHKLWK